MKKCFVFAMEEEAEFTIKELGFQEIIDSPFKLYKNKNDYLIISTIGTMNAAASVMWVNENYVIDEYYNLGLVGASNIKLNVLDVVIIDKVFVANVDATGFGYKLGQIPRMPEFLESNKISFKNNFKTVDLCSSNIFINSFELFNKNIAVISNTISVFDMELAGVYATLHKLNKPKYSIKVVSDVLSKENSELQFDEILVQGSKKILEIVKKISSI